VIFAAYIKQMRKLQTVYML